MMRIRDNSGFTLVEMLVGIILAGILIGIISVMVASTFRTMSEVSIRKKVVMDGAAAIALVQREVMTIRHSDSLLIADDDQLKFTNTWGHTIDYTITADSLHRSVDGGTAQIVATPIASGSTTFHYYDSSNTELTSVPLDASNRAAVQLFEFRLNMTDRSSTIGFLARIFPENYRIVE